MDVKTRVQEAEGTQGVPEKSLPFTIIIKRNETGEVDEYETDVFLCLLKNVEESDDVVSCYRKISGSALPLSYLLAFVKAVPLIVKRELACMLNEYVGL